MGMGNSPPARKSAVSPDSAVRSGSARVVTRPTCSPRSSASSRFSPSSLPAKDRVVPLVIGLTEVPGLLPIGRQLAGLLHVAE